MVWVDPKAVAVFTGVSGALISIALTTVNDG
jgi:hypothetical protein